MLPVYIGDDLTDEDAFKVSSHLPITARLIKRDRVERERQDFIEKNHIVKFSSL